MMSISVVISVQLVSLVLVLRNPLLNKTSQEEHMELLNFIGTSYKGNLKQVYIDKVTRLNGDPESRWVDPVRVCEDILFDAYSFNV